MWTGGVFLNRIGRTAYRRANRGPLLCFCAAVLYSLGQGPQEEEKRAALALFAALDPARFAVTAHPVPPGAPLPVLARKRPL